MLLQERYQYYVVPVHPEIKLNGEPVQGPRTQVITIEIPGQSIFDENFLEDILDWLRPGEKQMMRKRMNLKIMRT